METDDKANYFNELWRKQSLNLEGITTEQRDKIGVAYLSHIIGVDEGTIDAFLGKGEIGEQLKADDVIGRRQGGAEKRKEDYENFWREVTETNPCVYSQTDLSWLIENAGIFGVFSMVWHLQCGSDVLDRIATNAHAYK